MKKWRVDSWYTDSITFEPRYFMVHRRFLFWWVIVRVERFWPLMDADHSIVFENFQEALDAMKNGRRIWYSPTISFNLTDCVTYKSGYLEQSFYDSPDDFFEKNNEYFV